MNHKPKEPQTKKMNNNHKIKIMSFKSICLTLVITFNATWGVVAQTIPTLKPNPALHEIETAFANEPAVHVLDKRLHEYKNKGEQLTITAWHHRIIKIQSEAGVEMFNKIYVPIPYDGNIEAIEARVITPAGKIVDLPKDKILDVEEEGRAFKKFALEGVEIGCEVEILTRIEKGLGFFGLEVFQGDRTPYQQAIFELVVPEYLSFDTKGFNGIEVIPDTVIDKKRITYASGKSLPVIEEEKYGEMAPYLAHIQYKLSYNLSSEQKVRLFTWNQLAQTVYDNTTTFTEKELKAVASFLKAGKVNLGGSAEQKIIAIELYIKGAISISEEGIGDDASKIEQVLKRKVTDYSGIIRLFAASFKSASIPFELVYPNKRDKIPIDEKLENYRLIDNPVFYFTDTKKFMEPTNIGFRYPYLEPYNSGTKGLFIRTVALGGMTTAYAAFDTIPIASYENTLHNLEAKVALNASLDSVEVYTKHVFTGFTASLYRPIFNFLPAVQLQEVTKEILQSASPGSRVVDSKLTNIELTDGATNKPLWLEGNLMSSELLEQAGNRLLLKIGTIIGPQVEMYQEKERRLPLMIEYPHILDRKIEFTIPNGYVVKNLQDIDIKITGADSGIDDIGFVSSHTLNGNTLTIHIHEYYKNIHYSIARLDNYTKVINAAADFNKVVLVLEKQ